MANAKQCDRCGKYYDPNIMVLIYACMFPKRRELKRMTDLCPDCKKSLLAWMEAGKAEKKAKRKEKNDGNV